MINQYYKQSGNFDDKIQRLGQKLLSIDEEVEVAIGEFEDGENLYVGQEKGGDNFSMGSLMVAPDEQVF